MHTYEKNAVHVLYCIKIRMFLVLKPGDKLAGAKTLKRKRQLRELVENFNAGHQDDFFDSTPYRKRAKRAPVRQIM